MCSGRACTSDDIAGLAGTGIATTTGMGLVSPVQSGVLRLRPGRPRRMPAAPRSTFTPGHSFLQYGNVAVWIPSPCIVIAAAAGLLDSNGCKCKLPICKSSCLEIAAQYFVELDMERLLRISPLSSWLAEFSGCHSSEEGITRKVYSNANLPESFSEVESFRPRNFPGQLASRAQEVFAKVEIDPPSCAADNAQAVYH